MITLKAGNRALLDMNEAFSYLTNNYNSGVTALVVTNCVGFVAGDPVLIGQFGSEQTEIAYISSINTDSNTLTLENETKFSHPESTRVSILRYSMVEFLWGDGPDYDALGTPATSQDIVSIIGDSTTEWEITYDGVNDRTTYAWTGVGTNPRITDYFDFPIPSAGSFTQRGWINSPNFNDDNNITTLIGAAIYEVGEEDASTEECYFILGGMTAGTDETATLGAGYIKLESQYIDVVADNFYTIFRDDVLTTGFGYFNWWNPRSHVGTIVKSPIPYLGFPANSAKSIIDDFFSVLNSKELNLVTRKDAFRWLSEGYSVALNELNLVNKEYGSITPFAITTVVDQAEYALPANTSRISRVWNLSDDIEIPFIEYNAIDSFKKSNPSKMAYYLKGTKNLEIPEFDESERKSANDASEMTIGFTPTPSGITNTQVRYVPKAVPLAKNYDAIFLPNNNFYCLKDFMMFRAAPKLGRGDGNSYYSLFITEINTMKTNAIKQDNKLDSWGISPKANI